MTRPTDRRDVRRRVVAVTGDRSLTNTLSERFVGRTPIVWSLVAYAGALATVSITIGVAYAMPAPYWFGVTVSYLFYGLACWRTVAPAPADFGPGNSVVVVLLVLLAQASLWGATVHDQMVAVMPYSPGFLTCNVVFVMLVFRGRFVTAWSGVLVCLINGLIVGPYSGSPSWATLAIPTFSVLMLAAVTAASLAFWPVLGELDVLIVRRDRATDAQSTDRSSEQARADRLARIDDRVRPLLTKMVEQRDLTEADIVYARLVEAGLRDGIRGAALDTDVLRSAVWHARERGVSVTMLDDGGLGALDADRQVAVLNAVEAVAPAELAQLDHGDAVLRVAPAGRLAVASVTVAVGGAMRRTEIDSNGRRQLVTPTAIDAGS